MGAALRASAISVVLVALVTSTGAGILGASLGASGAGPGAGGAPPTSSPQAVPSGAPVAGSASGGAAPGASATSVCSPGLEAGTAASSGGAGSVPETGVASSGGAVTNGTPATTAPPASAVVAAAVADGACDRELFPPRAPATAAQIASARSEGLAQPLYTTTPAPIGIADYGLSTAPNGSEVPSVLDTTRLLGIVDANATGIEPLDLINAEPDAYSIQLNAVLTNVTLFGVRGYSFWTQNVVEFFPAARTLFLITNVWNFSGSTDFGDAIFQHGPYGQLYDDEVYIADVGYSGIRYPFDLSLYLNSTLVGGRDAVDFTTVLSGPGESINAAFDDLVFNSLRIGGPALGAPAQYAANGAAYNPVGLTDDFELDIGGPGGGSQATLMAADAELGLAYWNPSADHGLGGFYPVPSALNYGGETGETATGGTVTWSDAPGGPGGLGTYGTMATGPATLSGLWNATGPEGSFPVTFDVSPSPAFEVVTPDVSSAWTDLTPTLPTGPSVRSEPAQAYDPALGVTILFGGYDPVSGLPLNDTWEFSDGVWTELFPSVVPTARFGAGFAYDAADGYLVLFGGCTSDVSGQPFLNDTWAFTATGWHRLSPTASPAPRARVAMTYDAADSEIVLFGGSTQTVDTPGTTFDDTWVFHGGEWYNLTATAGTPPPASDLGAMAYDAADGYVLLVGGRSTGEVEFYPCAYDLPEEWAFSGGQWSLLSPTGAVPRAGVGTAWYDPVTERTYYYEGIENLSVLGLGCDASAGTVYSYQSGVWTLVELGGATDSPTPRASATVSLDPTTGTGLLFGGAQTIAGPFFSDTWTVNDSALDAPTVLPLEVPVGSVGPTVTTHTFWLAPGDYTVETALSGYAPVTTALSVSGPLTVSIALPPDPTLGIYTPLWAASNAALAAIATSGDGATLDPYVLPTAAEESGVLEPVFGIVNDYGYSAYPGLFLLDTNASVVVSDPPPFEVPVVLSLADLSLAYTMSLPLWFWNVSGVALVDSPVVGPPEDVYTASPFSATFYDSSDNLIAGDTFTGAGGLLLDQGPVAGPYSAVGGGNTVWGDQFEANLGLAELESGDLIFNNNFSDGAFGLDPACQPGNPALPDNCWPIYAFGPVSLSNTWNLTVMPASAVHYARGFPQYPLSGSILGTSWQGGNLWGNYGLASNPFGRLPYDNVVNGTPTIAPGGDFAPLIDYALYSVTFVASGLPEGAVWGAEVGIEVGSPSGVLYLDDFNTSASSYAVFLPNLTGAFYDVISPPGFIGAGDNHPLTVDGANQTITLHFVPGYYTVTFREEGLPATLLARYGWTVDLGEGLRESSRTAEISYQLSGGTYPLFVQGPSGWTPTPPAGYLSLPYANTTVGIDFLQSPTSNLVVSARGLPTGELWCFELFDDAVCSVARTIAFDNLTPGFWPFEVLFPLTGQSITASGFPGQPNATAGYLPVDGATVREVFTFVYGYPVAFTESGLASGTVWCAAADGASGCSASSTVTLSVPNGTFRYAIAKVAGYTYTGGSPRVVRIAGAPGAVAITFKPNHVAPLLYAPGPTATGVSARRPEPALARATR